MVLVDTNVWIHHIRSGSSELVKLLESGQVITHEFVLGELSLAHFSKKSRSLLMDRFLSIHQIRTSSHREVFEFSERHKLAGKGVGWIDAHLLHVCMLEKIQILTLDKSLASIAHKLAKS